MTFAAPGSGASGGFAGGVNTAITGTNGVCAPSPGATNVGVNAVIYVQFSTVIDPLSVTGSTVTISGASQTVVRQTITFDSTGTFAIIEPETHCLPVRRSLSALVA